MAKKRATARKSRRSIMGTAKSSAARIQKVAVRAATAAATAAAEAAVQAAMKTLSQEASPRGRRVTTTARRTVKLGTRNRGRAEYRLTSAKTISKFPLGPFPRQPWQLAAKRVYHRDI